MNINLKNILGYLADDNNFLSTIVETDGKELSHKKKDKKFNLQNMVTEYVSLSPDETQKYIHLPKEVKNFLSPDYMRFGVKNIIEKNMKVVNISFLNSLNILLRPDIYRLKIEEHIKNLHSFESFLCHKILRNAQIDKVYE